MTPVTERRPYQVMLGIPGTQIDHKSYVAQNLRDGLEGVILYGRNIANPDQLKELCLQIHTLNPFCKIAIDQEGGLVSRLTADKGFCTFPSAEEMGRVPDDLEKTRQTAAKTAQLLKECGIDINFAPVVDLERPDTYISNRKRAFSSDPHVVAAHSAAWVEEHRKVGIMTCPKHLPGHGSAGKKEGSEGDTHKGLVDVTTTWTTEELKPYKILNEQGLLDAVMIAHVIHRDLDGELPCSLSRKVVKGLVRDQIGFQGPIFTDDLQMGAIKEAFSLQGAVELALKAGAQWLLLANHEEDNGLYDQVCEIADRQILKIT